MNNKTLILIIGLIIVFGVGFIFLGNNSNKMEQPLNVNPTQAQISPSENKNNQKIQEAKVIVTTNGFTPQTLTVKAGTKVVWINQDKDVANVSSDVHPTHQVYPPLNLGNFSSSSSVQLVFEKAGTYKYHNHLNPSQTGTIMVE